MTNTKYSLYQEEKRLTLVIDNPTEETTAMIMKLMGAGIKDLTGLNPVKQEETSVPERKPDAQKTVAQEQEERKEEIERYVAARNNTVLNFPDRGPWGNNKYRGNCSGWIIAYLIWRYGVKSLAELFAGGGTGSDVCRDMDIPYIGADLNPNPVRNNILTTDAVSDEVPDEFRDKDMLFMHPPYGAEIGIPYAGSMYKDPTGKLAKSDLGQMPWKDFMKTLNAIIMKYYAAMAPGSKMAVLMGDVRRKGVYHSMFNDIVMPGTVLQTYVKMQNNCVSDGRTYSNRFTPIGHEMMYVIEKAMNAYLINYKIPFEKEMDIRNSQAATWKDVVYAAMHKLNKNATMEEIYEEIEGYKKCESNPHWKDKVRQTLQFGPFKSVRRGVWKLAAAA